MSGTPGSGPSEVERLAEGEHQLGVLLIIAVDLFIQLVDVGQPQVHSLKVGAVAGFDVVPLVILAEYAVGQVGPFIFTGQAEKGVVGIIATTVVDIFPSEDEIGAENL